MVVLVLEVFGGVLVYIAHASERSTDISDNITGIRGIWRSPGSKSSTQILMFPIEEDNRNRGIIKLNVVDVWENVQILNVA